MLILKNLFLFHNFLIRIMHLNPLRYMKLYMFSISKMLFSLLLGYAISCWKFLTQQFGFFLTHLKSIKFCFMIPPAHYSLVIASILAAVVIFLATFTRCFDWRCIEWLFRNIIKCTLFCTFYSPLRTHHKLSHLLCSSDIIF